MVNMISFVIVGSSWRAEFYGRVARTYPDAFRALFLCRSEEKARLMKLRTGIDAITTEGEALAFRPDFIVVAVDRAHLTDVAEQWATRGFPVVVETPAGDSEEQLNRMARLEADGAKIVCAEQYHRYPILAEGLRLIASGALGAPHFLYLSLAHDYHAASLIRHALLVGKERYIIQGQKFVVPVVDTDSRAGQRFDGHMGQETLNRALITFESGKSALYDFSGTQYHSFIRSRHITVRCERGEWSDAMIYGLDEQNQPWQKPLLPEIPEKYRWERTLRCLDTRWLNDLRKAWRPELHLDNTQDEFAIATLLLDMAEYLNGGPSPYPLWEAIEDARFFMRLRQSCEDVGMIGT